MKALALRSKKPSLPDALPLAFRGEPGTDGRRRPLLAQGENYNAYFTATA